MKYKIKPKFSTLNDHNHLFGIFDVSEHAKVFEEDNLFFQNWIAENKHGKMHFLEKNENVRLDPSRILPNVKSVLVFLFPYAHGHRVRRRDKSKSLSSEDIRLQNLHNQDSVYAKKLISKYVYSKDYHKIIKKYLTQYAKEIEKNYNNSCAFRPVVDSVPFFERAYGRATGLGFIGKNTLLIRPGIGSFFFIGSLLTNIDVTELADINETKNVIEKLDCGTCTKCIDACPTNAIEPNKTLNSNLCLSYLTIENRDIIPTQYLNSLKTTLYGCDICQDVCPYNFVTQDIKRLKEFEEVHSPLFTLTAEQIATMKEDEYQKWFGGTAMTRAKYEGLVRNSLCHLFAIKSESLTDILKTLQHSPYPLVKKTANQLLCESVKYDSKK